MKEHRRRRFGLTIKTRLLLLALAVLSIPYVGLQYLQEMERFLQDSLEQSLLDASRAIAGPLHDHPELFYQDYDNNQPAIFIHDIRHAMQIDGYTDDWKQYLDWSNHVYHPGKAEIRGTSPFFSILVARHGGQIYLLVQVNDDDIYYNAPDQNSGINGDYISLVYEDEYGHVQTAYFAPEAPGTMFPYRLQEYRPDDPFFEFTEATLTRSYITNMQGEWQETDDGFVLEIRIPEYMLGDRLGVIVNDHYSDNGIKKDMTIGSAGVMTASQPNVLLQQSRDIHAIIRDHARLQGRRVWVLDREGQVLAVTGNLGNAVGKKSTNLLYEWLLPSVEDRFRDDLAGHSRLEGEEVLQALAGNSGIRWRSPDRQTAIVSAAVPVMNGDRVEGVVMVEETSNRIQLVQRAAMTSLFNQTFLVFLVVTVLLLAFATHLSLRLRQLRRQVDSAVDEHGRVTGSITPLGGADEVTELSEHYVDLVERLKQYHDYLQSLSGKLSHELRTPMAVVQSSLDNLQDDTQSADDQQQYIQRAREGIRRLNMLVTRLSEAARIEQAIQSSEFEVVNLDTFLDGCIQGYRSAWPDMNFEYTASGSDSTSLISPELFAQMLDKLVANAVEFSSSGSPVRIDLEEKGGQLELSVTNYGSQLPAGMESRLFNSMVSVRDGKGEAPHLGLGLYIARLIAEFHGGHIRAHDLVEQAGVVFTVRFSSR